jgi:hypothetical protein
MLSTVDFVDHMIMAAAKHRKSVVVKFEIRPRICPPQCRGFHKTYYFKFNPDGSIEFQDSPYGFHSVVYPNPSFDEVEFGDAVRMIDQILREQEIVSGRRDDLAEEALLAKLELAYAS